MKNLVLFALLLVRVVPVAATAPRWLHPAIVALDAGGQPVTRSGNPVSPMRTCAGCHDTAYIESHSYHAQLGLDEMGRLPGGRSFDNGPGPLLRWDPLIYDRFDPAGNDPSALGVVDWIRANGARHVGGGFGDERSDDRPLPEMNCFLCHLPNPDNAARIEELSRGSFEWAATATLAATGLVERRDGAWRWNRTAFDVDGKADPELLRIREPLAANCGQCHGAVHVGDDSPFFVAPDPLQRGTATTGRVFAPTRIRRSGMNVAGKDSLSRPWDVHAERLLSCTACHPSLNNPAFGAQSPDSRPRHLTVDTRRLTIGEYLKTPSHEFAKGRTSQGTLRHDLDDSMLRCENCHDATTSHEWLPFMSGHMRSLQCEACHIPRQYAAPREQTDWTVLTLARSPRVIYRGADGDPADPRTMLRGYEPVLLPRTEPDGSSRLEPQNLATAWYWIDEEIDRPVARPVLRATFFGSDGAYRPEIVHALDENGDGAVEPSELRLDTEEKVAAVQAALRAQGVTRPAIHGEIQPYGVHHGVAPADWAIRDCQNCHGTDSRFSRDTPLAAYIPGGVLPTFVGDTDVELSGTVIADDDGALVYRPGPSRAGVFLEGFKHRRSVDVIGSWAVILVLLGVVIHGGTRLFLYQVSKGRRLVPEVRQ